ncbi:hypothetical protein ACFVIM_18670 [Streptomyces sp. NPDC057638]|uniref:hypothetical protein n=1 Tax=Streptomyces sp. NPDC057638 TaxID=3346190 RepID=UPI0036C2867E
MSNDNHTESSSWSDGPAPRRRFRALNIIVAVIAVLTVAGLLIANLASGDDGSDTPGSGSPRPDKASGTADAPGAARTEAGVPVGYPRTKAGAKAAASNFQAAQSTTAFLADPDTRRKITDVVMAPEAAGQRKATLDAQTGKLMAQLGILESGRTAKGAALINRHATLAAEVTSFSKDLATVELWSVAVTGVAAADSPLPPTSEFTQWNYTLRWDGDWKAATITRSAGLVPQTSAGQPSSPSAFQDLGGDADVAPFAR